ncbi:MAG: hypothetical protein IK139_05700 [Lachnospiraceae bacterium]|nr:hypothetical protein [Lachnospiraceae bacterium]
MIAQILGKYFVEKEFLTNGQLQSVLKKQQGRKVRLGTIAVSEGLMTLAQADAVNMLQQSIDKPFGDLAIYKGFLTITQVKSLLREQGNEFILFMQTLNDEGLMDVPAFESAVRQFQIDSGVTTTTLEAMKAGSIDAIIESYMEDAMGEFTDHVGVAVRLVIRIIDRDAYIGKARVTTDVSDLPSGVFQRVTTPEGETYICALIDEKQGLSAIASGFTKDQFENDDLFIIDAAGEFLNCINGLFCTTISHEEPSYDIEPQQFYSHENIPNIISGSKILHMPIYIGSSIAEFVIIR